MTRPPRRIGAHPADGRGLWRRRLVEQLAGYDAPRQALVLAPAGCGKSTLLGHAAAALRLPVAWYRATGRADGTGVFVRQAVPAVVNALDAETAPRVTGARQLLRMLDERAASGVVLVLDDLHELVDSGAVPALAEVLRLHGQGARVLLGSRLPLALNLSRLRVSDDLLHIDGDDLRFRTWEVEPLFRDVYGEPLPPESAAELTRRTDGWAAGLQMFHLATAGQTTAQRRRAVSSLGGHSRLIRSYLSDNVLDGLPPERRWFLLHTCTLGLLTGSMCDELLGTTGSQSVLRELEDAQLFTISDDDGLTFRYHQVLQDHLEVALEERLGERGAADWFRRSAAVLVRAGHVQHALRAHARAGDWGAVSQLLTRAGATVVNDGDSDWRRLLPTRLREHDPWLAHAEARSLLRRGAVRRAVAAYRHAESLPVEPGLRDRCRHERALAAQWLPKPLPPAVRSFAASPDHRHWSERLRAATARLPRLHDPPAPPICTADRLVAGLVDLLSGRVRAALGVLEEVTDDADPASLEYVASLAARAVGELVDEGFMTDRMEAAALAAGVAGQPWLERLCRAALEPALWESDDADAGGWAGHVAECAADDDEWGGALLLLLRGGVGALGATGDANQWLKAGASALRRLDAPVLAIWADAARTWDLRRRDAGAAGAVARRVLRDARSYGVHEAAVLAERALPKACSHQPSAPGHGSAADVPAAAVSLSLLGGFRLLVDGDVASLPGLRPRALMLLRRLALAVGVDIHRELLIDALWPGADVPTGARRLQVGVSSLRSHLGNAGLPGTHMLVRHGNAYRLVLPTGSTTDVHVVMRALAGAAAARARGDLPAAAALASQGVAAYTGDLLPEDGPAEWVAAERERIRLAVARAAHDLAQDQSALGDVDAAVTTAHRSLHLDPFQESPWTLLERLHTAAGDVAAAEHARARRAGVRCELSLPEPTTPRSARLPNPRGSDPARRVRR